jgi:protein-S-isoprenylcysteine O-methyltransferase Ste14
MIEGYPDSADHKESGMVKDRIWYKLRGILIAPVYIFSFFCWYWETEHWSTLVFGQALFLSGLSLRVWAQMHLHYRLKQKKTMTTTGPYSFVRNPIYIGNTLILTGTTFLSELFWLVPVMVVTCMATYAMTVRYEESHLRIKYGAPYVEYLQRVNRWLPRFKGQEDTVRYWQWNFFLPSIRAELHILLLLILPFLKEQVWHI